MFMHSALRTFDYHRWHAPVPGRVVETRMVREQAYLNVRAVRATVSRRRQNVLRALEGTDYQFLQTRRLVVIESPVGLVACLPVGMAQVSSVVITAESGVELHKGEEMGYFRFGGSNFVMVFERCTNIELGCSPGTPYAQGRPIGRHSLWPAAPR